MTTILNYSIILIGITLNYWLIKDGHGFLAVLLTIYLTYTNNEFYKRTNQKSGEIVRNVREPRA